MTIKQIEDFLEKRKNFEVMIWDINYRVKFDKDHTYTNNCFGEHSLNSQLIYLQPDINYSKLRHTFIHELLHWIFAVSWLSYKKEIEELEEEIVRVLSEHINLFLLMNKNYDKRN